MADSEKKKGLFGKAIDAFSSKDEKEEIAELEAELAAAQKAIKSLLDERTKSGTGKPETQKEVQAAEKRIADLERRLKAQTERTRVQRSQVMASKKQELDRKMAAKKAAVIATHTVQADETLSHIALKYYKHATPPYWKLLLEHNTELLDGNERNVRKGMELEIPELPEELKD